MSEPHVIRLREPWDRELLVGGGVRYSRYFNWPNPIEQGEVVLVCDGMAGAALATFNTVVTSAVPINDEWNVEVTSLLRSRNQVTFEFSRQLSNADLPWREVRLEIREV